MRRSFASFLVFVALAAGTSARASDPRVPLLPPRINNAAGIKYRPTLVHARTQSLSVWADHRGGVSNLIGARVSDAGRVEDVGGIEIGSLAPSPFGRPLAVASDGEDFLVAFTCRSGNICTRVVRADGSTGTTFTIGQGAKVDVIWNGESYVAAFSRYSFTDQVFFEVQKVARDGSPAGSSKRIDGFGGRLAYFMGRTIIIYSEASRTYAAVLSPEDLLESSRRMIVDRSTFAEVATSERTLAVSWHSGKSISSIALDFTLTPSAAISTPGEVTFDEFSTAWVGDRLFVAAEARSERSLWNVVRVAEVDFGSASARWRDHLGLVGNDPHLSSSSGVLSLLWTHGDDPNSANGVVSLLRLVPSTFSLLHAEAISIGVASTTSPSACREGDQGVAAWVESEGPFARRAIHYGTLQGNPSTVKAARRVATSTDDQYAPEVYCIGQNRFLLWTQSKRDAAKGELRIAAMSADGVAGSSILLSSDAQPDRSAAMEWTGSKFVIAFTRADSRMVTISYDPRSGAVTEPQTMSEVPSFQGESDPELAWGGNSLLLTWTYQVPSRCQILCPASWPSLNLRILDSNGSPKTAVRQLLDPSTGSYSAKWRGDAFVVLHHGYRGADSTFDNGTFVTLIASNGAVGEPRTLSSFTGQSVLFLRANRTSIVGYAYADNRTYLQLMELGGALEPMNGVTLDASHSYTSRTLVAIERSSGPRELIALEYDAALRSARLFVRQLAGEPTRSRTRSAR